MTRDAEECLNAYKTVNNLFSDTLERDDYEYIREPDAPSATDIVMTLGPWGSVKQLAAVTDLDAVNPATHHPANCVANVGWVADQLGHAPTVREYHQQRMEDDPSALTVITHLGPWDDVRDRVEHTAQSDTSEMERAIRHVSAAVGNAPATLDQYMEHRPANAPTINEILDTFGDWRDAVVAAGFNGNPTKYTDEYCLESAVEIAEELDKLPTTTEYNDARDDLQPSAAVLSNRLGGHWDDVKETMQNNADLGDTVADDTDDSTGSSLKQKISGWMESDDTEDDGDANTTSTADESDWVALNTDDDDAGSGDYTKPECVAAVVEVADQFGYTPTKQEYDRYRDEDDPSPDVVTDHLGSWYGISERIKRTARPDEDWCGQAIREVAVETGAVPPTVDQYMEYKPEDAPSAREILDEHGSWGRATYYAGFPENEPHYSTEFCLDCVVEVADDLGKIPTTTEYSNNRDTDQLHPSITTVQSRFDDGWGEVKAKVEERWDGPHTDDENDGEQWEVPDETDDTSLTLSEMMELKDKRNTGSDKRMSTTDGVKESDDVWNRPGEGDDGTPAPDTGAAEQLHQPSIADCVGAVMFVAGKLGRAPTIGEYVRHRPEGGPLVDDIFKRYETWGDVTDETSLTVSGESSGGTPDVGEDTEATVLTIIGNLQDDGYTPHATYTDVVDEAQTRGLSSTDVDGVISNTIGSDVWVTTNDGKKVCGLIE